MIIVNDYCEARFAGFLRPPEQQEEMQLEGYVRRKVGENHERWGARADEYIAV